MRQRTSGPNSRDSLPNGPHSGDDNDKMVRLKKAGKPSAWCMLLLTAVTALTFVLVTRTAAPHNRSGIGGPRPTLSELGSEALAHFVTNKHVVASRLSEAVRFKTVSVESVKQRRNGTATIHDRSNVKELQGLLEFLRVSYPNVHSKLVNTPINGVSMLYEWPGVNPALKPILLMAHLDVVPVTGQKWSVDPFEGKMDEEFVWGRGTIDDKHAVIGILEAVEYLLQRNFAPQRTVYIALGHDEEIHGEFGAQTIVKHFQSTKPGLRFEFVLDEGMTVLDGVIPDVPVPVAMIGVMEKGYATVKLEATATAGHSSAPPKETAIGILARAIVALETRQLPSYIHPMDLTMRALAMEMPFLKRIAVSNLWLFSPLVIPMLLKDSKTATILRSTTAVTMVWGGDKDNVLPETATAVVNHRIHPRDTVASVLQHDIDVIDDNRVNVSLVTGSEPSSVASITAFGFSVIGQAIQAVYPRVVVAPGAMVGATDSRFFDAISDNTYKFSPTWLTPEDVSRFHVGFWGWDCVVGGNEVCVILQGVDERIAIDNLAHVPVSVCFAAVAGWQWMKE